MAELAKEENDDRLSRPSVREKRFERTSSLSNTSKNNISRTKIQVPPQGGSNISNVPERQRTEPN